MAQALENLFQQLINGIQLGSVYALIAVGYTMVYGVLKFINFAHGDVYMIGAYTGLFAVGMILQHSGPIPQDIVVLFLCMGGCALMGAFIERLAYRPLRNGLGPTDAPPWALFWALYLGLFLGPICEKYFHLPSIAAFALVVAIATGVLIPVLKIVFRSLGGKLKPSRNRLTALITAIGISLLLENQGQALFGASPQQYPDQGFPSLKIPIGPSIFLNINVGRIIVLCAAVVLMLALVYIVRKTRTGRAIRAVSYDIEAAALMGIPTDRIIALTFIIGSALAGAGGFLNHNLGQIKFDANVGIQFGLKAFIAAVLGGIGSIEGAVLGAMLMGLAESFTGGSSLNAFKDAVAFVILISVLLFRPAGILGKNTVEKV